MINLQPARDSNQVLQDFYNRAESATVPGAGLVVWLQAVQPLLVIHNYEIKLWN